jgi:hypothetical protein
VGFHLPVLLHEQGLVPSRSPLDPFRPAGDTVVGNDVWIGTEAMIMPGVKIGHGAVVGSRALVTRDCRALHHRRRHPAKPIRKRFSDEEIAMLLELAWWEMAARADQGCHAAPVLVGHRRAASLLAEAAKA